MTTVTTERFSDVTAALKILQTRCKSWGTSVPSVVLSCLRAVHAIGGAKEAFLVMVVASGCASDKAPPPIAPHYSMGADGGAADTAAGSSLHADPSRDWTRLYDFDGDGIVDVIVYEFTGGAHCCYRIGVSLSSTGETIMIPFEMDGGYVGGLEPHSQPQRFSLKAAEGGLPEIIMEIETYNSERAPSDTGARKRHGIRTHRIAVCFAGGELSIRDSLTSVAACPRRAR